MAAEAQPSIGTGPTQVGRAIVSGVVAGWIQTAVSIVVSFLQIRLVLQAFPAQTAGVWLVFITLGGYIAFFDFGVSPTLSREIGFALGRHRDVMEARLEIVGLVATSLRIFIGLSLLALILAFTVGSAYVVSIAPTIDAAAAQRAWLVFAVGSSLNLLGGASFAAIFGLGGVGVDRWIRAVVQLLGLGLAYAALVLGYGLVGLSVAWLAQGLGLSIIGWTVLLRLHPWMQTTKGNPSLGIVRRLALPSLQWTAIMFGAVLILNTDNIVIASTLGSESVPDYALVARMVNIALSLSLLLASSSSPFVSKAFAAGDLDQVKSLLLRGVRLGVAFMSVVAATLLVYGGIFVDLWVGPGHFVGYGVLVPFIVMLTLEAHHVAHVTALTATGRLPFVWIALGAGVLNIALSLVLVRPLGVSGVALATMLTQLLTNNWYVPLIVLRQFGLPIKPYLREVAAPLALLLVVAISVAFAFKTLLGLFSTSPIVAILGAAASAAVSGTAAFKLVLLPEERVTLLGRIRRRSAQGVGS